MSIRPKSKVLANICYTQHVAGGKSYPHYCAELGTYGKKRIRIHASSLAECKRRVEKWYESKENTGDSVAALSMKELADATLAIDRLRTANCTKTLYEIVVQFLENHGDALIRTRLTDAYDLYFKRLTDAQDTQKQLVKVRVGRFIAKHPTKYVDEISCKMLLDYLDGMGFDSPKTWNNNMQYLRTFFNWCMKRTNNFCMENPLQDVENKKQKAKVNECASVQCVRELFAYLLKWDDPRRDLFLLRNVLNFFGGMRVSETVRQKITDIRIEDGSVLVREPKGSQTGKTSFRTFRIEDCGGALSKWLKVVDMEKAASARFVSMSSFKNIMTKIRASCKHNVPDNAGRHSFISYHVAAFGDPRKTESVVGTSEEMRKHNYQTLMTKADGEAYFAITPKSCGLE